MSLGTLINDKHLGIFINDEHYKHVSWNIYICGTLNEHL